LVITNIDYENVIGVTDINKIILYFQVDIRALALGSPVFIALLTACYHCCLSSFFNIFLFLYFKGFGYYK